MQKYAFRQSIDEVHKKNRRNPAMKPKEYEIVIDEYWTIDGDCDFAVTDLQNYFERSMNLNLRRGKGEKCIQITGEGDGFTLDVAKDGITITGNGRQGIFYLEDVMNLREAPFVTAGRKKFKPLFSPRMVHSGWGLDQYPDAHLNAIAHAGFDAVIVFVKGVDLTTHGVMDFNDLVYRAGHFGLKVYFYSYLDGFKHPDEADAEEFFDRTYGSIFQHCPGAGGLILVGESSQFPSRDPRSTGKRANYNNVENEGLADHRPAPGWFPCSDYPAWLNAVKTAVHRYQPEAEIIFWTYNWGNIAEKERLEFIDALPSDITLEATFEMFESRKFPEHTTVSPDYSITFPGPGRYFISEAQRAKKRNLKLCTMSNSAGTTWDCGVIPFVPVPQQWFRRFRNMAEAHAKWGLSADMACHHYGWYPSVISECARWFFRDPSLNLDELLLLFARRDFGVFAAQKVVDGWALCSEAMNQYAPGFDDQAGPLRVGAAYPLIFHPILYPGCEHKMQFPTTLQSTVGGAWLHPFYNPEEIGGQSNCGRRVPAEIRLAEKALLTYASGLKLLNDALVLVPAEKLPQLQEVIGVNGFFYHALVTMVHTKKWWLLNKKLELAFDPVDGNQLLDEMESIVDAELGNVNAAILLARNDSRLGYEPSMDYMADEWHLNWKVRQLNNLKNKTLPNYRQSLHS